jgi:hypothetical protein
LTSKTPDPFEISVQATGGQSLNPRRAAAWQRLLYNIPVNPGDPTMDGLAQSVRDVPAEDNFWVFQTLTGYTGKVVTPIGVIDAQGSNRDQLSAAWYFVEYARQSYQTAGQGKVDEATSLQRLAYHEALHSFNIKHNTDAGVQGIMLQTKQFFGADDQIRLTDRQVDIMLDVVRPK